MKEVHAPERMKNQSRLYAAMVEVRAVRKDLHKAEHRVDAGVCEAVLRLLRDLREAQREGTSR